MKILTWGGADVPPTHAWCARFQVGKQLLPAIIYAATEEAVVAKAQAFWDSETEKARNRMVGKHRRPQTTEERICERGQPETVEEGVGQTDTPVTDDANVSASNADLIEQALAHSPLDLPANTEVLDLLA